MSKNTNYFLATQSELRDMKSKCRISRNGAGNIRLQWGHDGRRYAKTPPNCDMSMDGIAYARHICLAIDRQLRIDGFSDRPPAKV